MSAELIEAPPIVAVLVKYLKLRLGELGDDAHVSSKIPASRPTRLVKVQRTGGPRRSLVMDAPQITAQCWEVTEPAAERLASRIEGLIDAMPREDFIDGAVIYSYVEMSGPALFPDLETGIPRYQFTGQLLVRCTVI